MAYTLKTSGLALKLTMCLAIDSDGSTITEFVSSTVNSQKTIDAGVTTGSSTWAGVSRGYFQTATNAFDYKGVRFGATRPAYNASSPNKVSFFIACGGMPDGSGNTQFPFMEDTSNLLLAYRNATTEKLVDGYGDHVSTTSLPLDPADYSSVTKFSAGFSHDAFNTYNHYRGVDGSSLAADGNGADAGFGSSRAILGFGGGTGTGSQPARYHIACAFNDALTLADFQSLHNDWFGTLFDSAAVDTLMGQACL